MIRYSLTKNEMNPDTDGFIAKIQQWKKTDFEDVLNYMTAEGSGLTRPQALAYFEKLMQTFEYFIETRGSVVTPLCHIQISVKGNFLDENDKFDSERHSIHLRIKPGTRLKELKTRLKLVKNNRPEIAPNPDSLFDIAGNTTNKFATPRSIATLKGKDLKFDPEDETQGIFFIPENQSKENFRVTLYSSIATTKIHFLIPDLPPGKYTIVVKSIMRRHKSIRSGILRQLITVL